MRGNTPRPRQPRPLLGGAQRVGGVAGVPRAARGRGAAQQGASRRTGVGWAAGGRAGTQARSRERLAGRPAPGVGGAPGGQAAGGTGGGAGRRGEGCGGKNAAKKKAGLRPPKVLPGCSGSFSYQ